MSGQKRSRVLDARDSLDPALCQIPELPHDTAYQADGQQVIPRDADEVETPDRPRGDDCSDRATDGALPGLSRRYRPGQWAPPEALAHVISGCVRRPDKNEDGQGQPERTAPRKSDFRSESNIDEKRQQHRRIKYTHERGRQRLPGSLESARKQNIDGEPERHRKRNRRRDHEPQPHQEPQEKAEARQRSDPGLTKDCVQFALGEQRSGEHEKNKRPAAEVRGRHDSRDPDDRSYDSDHTVRETHWGCAGRISMSDLLLFIWTAQLYAIDTRIEHRLFVLVVRRGCVRVGGKSGTFQLGLGDDD